MPIKLTTDIDPEKTVYQVISEGNDEIMVGGQNDQCPGLCCPV